jgi:hypothetical protein
MNLSRANDYLSLIFRALLQQQESIIFCFDFIAETFALPRFVIQTQLFANLVFGCYGVMLFTLSGMSQASYRFLIRMNFLYAILCIVVGVALYSRNSTLGAFLLLGEGTFILVLAKFERDAFLSALVSCTNSVMPKVSQLK